MTGIPVHPDKPASLAAPISLLIVDDHEMFREGLVALLKQERELKVVAQAANGEAALAKLLLFRPRVVIVDVSLPDMHGADLARKIRNRLPDTRIVALSMHAEPQFLALMLKEGAAAYVLKNDAFKELVAAIRSSLGEGARPYLSRSVADVPIPRRKDGAIGKRTLSQREEDVLRLLATGLTTREIAERIQVSARTVDTYRARMMEKLAVDNHADLVKRAITLGLTSLG